MNSKELDVDERIKSLVVTLVRPDVPLAQQKEETRQLIRDCIQAVTPEVEDYTFTGYEDEKQNMAWENGYVEAIVHIEANTTNLLGK